MTQKTKKRTIWIFLLIGVFGFILHFHNISKDITDEDLNYIKFYLPKSNTSKSIAISKDFKKQLLFIELVQNNLNRISPLKKGIPKNQERNPKNLYEYKGGLCYDKSFVIEKIFTSIGFETRHVALYFNLPNKSLFQELLTSEIKSHAATEIKTNKGWMIIDPTFNWIGIDSKNEPVSLNQLKKNNYNINWKSPPPRDYFTSNFNHVYGLYSRHGKFFEPYNFIPDYNLQELIINVL